MPIYCDFPPPPPAFVYKTDAKDTESDSESSEGILNYGTAGPFRYKVLLEDFWDWCDSEDGDDDLD